MKTTIKTIQQHQKDKFDEAVNKWLEANQSIDIKEMVFTTCVSSGMYPLNSVYITYTTNNN